MNSTLTADEVRADLGDKVVEGLAEAVSRASDDLRTYRQAFPLFVAEHSERGLANWIHDRLWSHLNLTLADACEVHFRDAGVHREITVGTNCKLRIKRHSDAGAIASYDTQGALEFYAQSEAGQIALDGLTLVTLAAGYVWDPELREMGDAVLSLRDRRPNLIWQQSISSELTPPIAIEAATGGGPARPVIELAGDRTSEEEAGDA